LFTGGYLKLRNLLICTWYTILDELHHKSFYVLTIIAIGFTWLLKGCFTGNYTVNGEQINKVTIGWNASLIGFNIIAFGGVLTAILLSMRAFLRDRDDGSAVMILSKPVNRMEYLVSKVIGLWILSYGLIFILHTSVYIIMLINTGGGIVWYYPASLILSLNMLAIICIVMLCTLFLPDVLSAILGIVIAVGSLIIDLVYSASQTEIAQNIMRQVDTTERSASWVWVAWPKISALQLYATSLIKQSDFHALGPLHPVVNILIYIVISFVITAVVFNRRDVI
jgi:ABC-type transport system involved in multi-copper enzyme maturation permease subunit